MLTHCLQAKVPNALNSSKNLDSAIYLVRAFTLVFDDKVWKTFSRWPPPRRTRSWRISIWWHDQVIHQRRPNRTHGSHCKATRERYEWRSQIGETRRGRLVEWKREIFGRRVSTKDGSSGKVWGRCNMISRSTCHLLTFFLIGLSIVIDYFLWHHRRSLAQAPCEKRRNKRTGRWQRWKHQETFQYDLIYLVDVPYLFLPRNLSRANYAGNKSLQDRWHCQGEAAFSEDFKGQPERRFMFHDLMDQW